MAGKKSISFAFLFLLLTSSAFTQTGRLITDLSNNDWKLWLDTEAKWEKDQLFISPVDIKKLPVNIPTGGWIALNKTQNKIVHLPATAEQYYWGRNGNTFGVSGNYLGVSWFTTKFIVPLS